MCVRPCLVFRFCLLPVCFCLPHSPYHQVCDLFPPTGLKSLFPGFWYLTFCLSFACGFLCTCSVSLDIILSIIRLEIKSLQASLCSPFQWIGFKYVWMGSYAALICLSLFTPTLDCYPTASSIIRSGLWNCGATRLQTAGCVSVFTDTDPMQITYLIICGRRCFVLNESCIILHQQQPLWKAGHLPPPPHTPSTYLSIKDSSEVRASERPDHTTSD